MSALRKVKAYLLGMSTIHASPEELKEAAIPVSKTVGDCRSCSDPCDQGHEDYPSRFNVDMETQMFGSVKPYRRQVVISTGKSDWPSHIENESGSLAARLESVISSMSKPPSAEKSNSSKRLPGVFEAESATRISILNGSHHTVCDDPKSDTVLVFPDYKVVIGVEKSEEGARQLYKCALDPTVGRTGNVFDGLTLKSWILPYSCVILMCSHKRRDNRCGIAAPKLENAFTSSLEREGWDVHRQLEDPSLYGPPLEEFKGSDEEKDAEIEHQLRSVADTKRALIVRNSHMGGHKFAGNCIIYMPQAVSVWYGRITPHQVDVIVKETIIGGKVLPSLLRGGLNLSRPGHSSLTEW